MKISNFKFQISKYRKGLPREARAKWGFTILESLVAIGVLSLSISGAFSAVVQSLSQASISKDEVSAFYLAQEGMEMIRNKRDSNLLKKILVDPSSDWLSPGPSDNYNFVTGMSGKVEASLNLPFTDCPSPSGWNDCPVLNQDTGTFLYNYGAVSASNVATNFNRAIQVKKVPGIPEVIVIIQVTWPKGGNFKTKEFLFDWI